MTSTMRLFWVLMDSPLLLDFLEPKDVISALHASHERLLDQPAVLYQWIRTRLHPHWKVLPPTPPREYLHPRVLFQLLEQLHVMSTYEFSVRFDEERRAEKLRLTHFDDGSLCRTAAYGSIYANRHCVHDAVNYWEVRGITVGCYVGVAEEVDAEFFARTGFHFGQHFDLRPNVFLAKKVPACNLLPAIMYAQTGEITTGEFRGPRLPLPGGLRSMRATTISPDDSVGICVDLWQGQLLFFLNRVLQARIALDRRRRYVPVFTCQTYTSSLFLHLDATPPWDQIYDHAAFREEAQYLAIQPVKTHAQSHPGQARYH
ncbi:hypothetical protein Poli38472_005442 [Pythium oligandrum]|uniref:Uncharacterized protein n=1 Tax=Pythium oligandrum TaxID=41045 RepID=A0A8K1CGW8_PYTOL|nr:hypothetical protein Poli38472_005442 [Pythium oligandrum]|eukprot:TMW62824.1 hypothetical protein Poli38472_005442 [Pythium oligandrum]